MFIFCASNSLGNSEKISFNPYKIAGTKEVTKVTETAICLQENENRLAKKGRCCPGAVCGPTQGFAAYNKRVAFSEFEVKLLGERLKVHSGGRWYQLSSRR